MCWEPIKEPIKSFTGMKQEVHRYVQGCDVCQLNKGENL